MEPIKAVRILYDLLRISPFLSINAPETTQTHHFLDAKAIACLPRGAIVVNAARGGIVVDEDLIAALKTGQSAAVGRDTYEGEPKLNPGYLSLKNTFLLPHTGAATIETRTAMGMLALDNIDAVLQGWPAPSLVLLRLSPELSSPFAQDVKALVNPILNKSVLNKIDALLTLTGLSSVADVGVLHFVFLSSQSQSFTNLCGGSPTWHDSCTFLVASCSRN